MKGKISGWAVPEQVETGATITTTMLYNIKQL
jgi:hypothetical protein